MVLANERVGDEAEAGPDTTAPAVVRHAMRDSGAGQRSLAAPLQSLPRLIDRLRAEGDAPGATAAP
jgi:hypothetical protein